ncbi:MAG: 5'/3'-nucleotidase SurE [Bacteroidales bacterium]|nr:5'/3'-nucleotidase SurE [Bacteroidales bacterium]
MNQMSEKLILISNDDGFFSKGIALLADVMQRLGRIVVVAPKSQMSGQSHSITVVRPISFKQEMDMPFECYSVDGTPVDCVKLGLHRILTKKPDLIVAGVNHGCNASINTIYSGTMAATFAGCEAGIPSVGFSIDSDSKQECLDYIGDTIYRIAKSVLTNGLESGICLNVNFPVGQSRGIKVCHQANAFWEENFVEKGDEEGEKFYWLNGECHLRETSPQADLIALHNGYTTITPMHTDFTAHHLLKTYAQRFETQN